MGKIAEKPTIMELLASATAEDLEQVRGEIAATQKKLDGLQAAERLLDIQLHGKPPKKCGAKKKAAATDAAPKVNGDSQTGGPEALRLRVAQHLLKNGIVRGGPLAELCHVSASYISTLCKHDWFMSTEQGYALTPKGKQAIG